MHTHPCVSFSSVVRFSRVKHPRITPPFTVMDNREAPLGMRVLFCFLRPEKFCGEKKGGGLAFLRRKTWQEGRGYGIREMLFITRSLRHKAKTTVGRTAECCPFYFQERRDGRDTGKDNSEGEEEF